MAGLITGTEPRQSAYCSNCRTTGVHKLIAVTADLTLLWCERCRVPHRDSADAVTEMRPLGGVVEASFATESGPRLVCSDGAAISPAPGRRWGWHVRGWPPRQGA